MITHKTTGGQTNTYYGKSSDAKPVSGVPNASIFYEIDSGLLFMFDKDSQTWINNNSASTPSGSGSGPGLPDASQATDGQVLMVDDGDWTIGDAPSGGGGSADVGWTVSESAPTVLCSESVTTAGDYGFISGPMTYSTFIDADTIVVTFNGTEYECSKTIINGANAYGGVGANGPDFSEYPFAIQSEDGYDNTLFTETAGTYTISISAPTETVETTENFRNAVNSVLGDGVFVVGGTVDPETDDITLNKTWQEIYDAFEDGKAIIPAVYEYFTDDGVGYYIRLNQIRTVYEADGYYVEAMTSTGDIESLVADTANGYPTITSGDSGGEETAN